MITKLHARQLSMQLDAPDLPSQEGYLDVMYAGRAIGKNPAQLQAHLEAALAGGRICRTDARCIWRGVMRQWATPWD